MPPEDYKAVLDVVRATLNNALRQNEVLINCVKFYADEATYTVPEDGTFRPIETDCGELAREILDRIMH